MPVTTANSDDGQELTISIVGRFDNAVQTEFKDSYQNVTVARYIVDFTDTDFIDSSALGMLMMMREHLGGEAADITLKNCSQDIKVILSVSNFQNLFTID